MLQSGQHSKRVAHTPKWKHNTQHLLSLSMPHTSVFIRRVTLLTKVFTTWCCGSAEAWPWWSPVPARHERAWWGAQGPRRCTGWGQHTEGSCTRLSDCPRKMALGSSTPWCLWSPTATAVMILTAMIIQLEVTIMAFQHTRQDRRKKKKKITSLVQVYKWVQHLQLLQTATPV